MAVEDDENPAVGRYRLRGRERIGSDVGPATAFAAAFARMSDVVEETIIGKPGAVRLALVCLLAEGHLLIEDVPGVGKTSLARALATAVGGTWGRIQFTPDLLPTDITGTLVLHPGGGEEVREGPIFANIVLCDEVNRASPKTQSALLEVMEERQVTIDRDPRPVPRPFVVVATQNPVEMAGTYPLPEAQLDRFLMRIHLGYPDHDAEVRMLRGAPASATGAAPPFDPPTVQALIRQAETTHIADSILSHIVTIADATRNHPLVTLGVSPRGGKAMVAATRVYAAAAGRDYVVPDDIRALAVPVFGHRILLTPRAELDGVDPARVLDDALATAPMIPTGVH